MAFAGFPISLLAGYVPYTGATTDLDLGIHGLTVGGFSQFNGRTTFGGNVVYTPTTDSTTTGANANIPDHQTAYLIVTNVGLTSIGSIDITHVSDGHLLILENKTGAAITIVNNYGSAPAGSVIHNAYNTNITLPDDGHIFLLYDSTDGAWEVVNSIPQNLATTGSPTFANITDSAMTAGSVLFAGTAGILSQDNANFFYDPTNHKLGLGTATPKNKLQLDGATGYGIVFDVANSSAMGHNFYWSGSAWTYIYSSQGVSLVNYCDNSTSGDVSFYQAPAGTAGTGITFTTPTLYLKNSNHFVGLGMTNPLYPLHVLSSYAGVMASFDSSNAAYGAQFQLDSTPGGGHKYILVAAGHSNVNVPTDSFALYDASNSVYRYILTPAGKHLFGTTSVAIGSDLVEIGATYKLGIAPDFAGSGEIPANSVLEVSTTGNLCFLPDGANSTAGKVVQAAYYDGSQFRSAWEIANSSGFGTLKLMKSGGATTVGGVLRLKGYTVGTLPTGTQGDTAFCTDLLLPTFLAVAVGGGAVVGKVFYNGTNWITD